MLRAMQIRMRNYALHQFARIDLRTITVMQALDLANDFVDDPAPSVGANLDLAVIQDDNHSRRIRLSPGPLLLYLTQDEKPKRVVVELPALLYSNLPDVRKAILACLERMVADGSLDTTPKTRKVLGESRAGLLSDVPHEWWPAAVALSDAFRDDVLVALQGTRQSLECEPIIKDSLDSYAPRVIHPAMSSLDSMELEIRNPESEHPKLAEIVQSVVAEAKSLGEACAKYYSRLGHLPLAPSYAMGEVVSRWMTTHPATDAWAEVWGWAYAAFGPVPRYHACSVFVLRPDLVPNGKLPDLWNEILGVVNGSGKKGSERINHEPWALRRDLARHFAYHLEANLPDNDGANIACFAWWFAEQVAALFSDEAKSAQFYRKNWVEPAADRSSQIWLAASPRIGKSVLRYVTFSVNSPWASGLLALMGAKLEQLASAEQSAETRSLFHDALLSHLISLLPFPVEAPADPTFSLECSMSETALKWASCQSEEQRKVLEQLVAFGRTLGSVEGLCKALRGLADSSLADKVAIALSLKAKSYTDPAVAAGVWEVLSDGEWRRRVFGAVEENILGLLFEAFSILQVANKDKWFTLLPHYMAELCEKTENDERRRHLFLYVVLTSLASDTVSAVRRLLRGSQKAKFVKMAREYRERMESIWAQCPPWVASKLRALIASLHVV